MSRPGPELVPTYEMWIRLDANYWVAVGLSSAVFMVPPITAFTLWCLREVRELRALRRRDQAEAEALRAEGFPPGRPTHHRPSKSSSG